MTQESQETLLARDVMRGRLTRRGLLRRAAVLGLSVPAITALLAACGGDDETTPTTAATRGTTGTTGGTTTTPVGGATTTSATTPASSPAAGAAGAATPAASPAGSTAVKISGPFDGEAKTLNGAGATFPAVLYSKWFNEYEKVTSVKVNYQSIGSGGGIKSIQDGTVDFGATDGPMTDEQLAAAKNGNIFHIPMALGAVVPTYNVPEVEGKEALKFTPETLAGIFLGDIKKWNDPKLVADNPALSGVNKDIVVVHRSDGSGTTFIWVDYLANVSADWKSKVGVGTSVKWPVGLGGKGNEGVAGEVKQNPYSLGYVELIYAEQNKLGKGAVKNKAGRFVTPTVDSVTAAAAGVAQTIQPDLRASIVNAEGQDSYPVSGFTWILAYENMTDQAKAIALTRLLWWNVTEAQKFNKELGYAPLPAGIVEKALEKIKAIKVDGKAAFPGR